MSSHEDLERDIETKR